MKQPLNKQNFEEIVSRGCMTPGCSHEDHGTLFLHPQCHPKANIDVSYTRGTGVLKIACSHCDKLIIEVEIADDEIGRTA